MKRYDLELTATGSVMEEHEQGAFVPFSEVSGLADTVMKMSGRCTLLADLLREARNPLITAMDASSKDESAAIEDLIDCIEAALAGQLPGAWLPIETAPHDGRKALVYRPLAENSGYERIAVKRLTGSRSNHCWGKTVPPGETPCNPTDGACHVTHWMPLPDEPAQQGGEPCATASPSSSKA